MTKMKIFDIAKSQLHESKYDLAIFCSGYEPRCTYLSETINLENIEYSLVFSYAEHTDTGQREFNEKFLIGKWGKSGFSSVSSSRADNIFKTLHKWFNDKDSVEKVSSLKVLVDYSSMTKPWLSTVIFFFLRYIQEKQDVNICIDFSYSIGVYPKVVEERLYSTPVILPGCEGAPLTHERKSAIFLLGFDQIGPQVIFNALNPERSYGVYAAPSARESYIEKVLTCNSEFIAANLGGKDNLLGLPLSSVTTTFDNMHQVVAPLLNDNNIAIALFGPKPHVLASILLANYYPNITCLYATAANSKPTSIEGIGELVLTRVIYE